MSRATVAWALGGALRFAIGTCVVALLLATTLSGDGAERFATTAYIAAIFATAGLIIQRFLPAVSTEERGAIWAPPFPAFLAYSAGVVIFLSVVAALVSQPSAEVLALIGSFALIVVAALVRCGAVAALNGALARGGFLVAASRYAAVVGVCALGFAALGPGDTSDGFANVAYRLTILATLFIAASLIAPTSAGLWLRKSCTRAVASLDELAQASVFERTVKYAAAAAVAAMIPASLLPVPFAEPFAIVAYLAAGCAAIGVVMECRRLRS